MLDAGKVERGRSVAATRAEGRVRVTARPGPRGTALRDLYQRGSLKALFPHAAGPALDLVLLNTAGGLTGGDRMDVTVEAEPGAALSVTTQAAERAYASDPDAVAEVETRLVVGPGARVGWLPQETILFDRCALHRRLVAEIGPGAELLVVEPVVLGRRAMGETVRQGRFRDRIDIRRDGAPLYSDRVALRGDMAAAMAGPATGRGAGAWASVVLVSERAEGLLRPVRALLPETAGASLLARDLMVVRILGIDGYDLRLSLVPLLMRLTGTDLPRPWMI